MIAGILNQAKAKKILAAPFEKTGEIAKNPPVAGAKGTVRCEGALAVPQPLMAPCSGKPCVYDEIELVRHWEKTVQTENGLETEKGTPSISTNHQGQHRAHVPAGGDHRTVGVKCIEKIIPAQGNLFVLGELAAGAIRSRSRARGRFVTSSRGRARTRPPRSTSSTHVAHDSRPRAVESSASRG